MSEGGTGRRSSLRRRHLIVLSVQLAATVLLLTLSGCSTAPFADMLDFFAPGRPPANAKDVSGGVCIPQGGPAGGVLGGPPLPPGPGPFKGLPPGVVEPPPPAPISQTPLPGPVK